MEPDVWEFRHSLPMFGSTKPNATRGTFDRSLTMYDNLTSRLWVFAVKRLNNIARTLGPRTMAICARRAGLPIELALAACKGV